MIVALLVCCLSRRYIAANEPFYKIDQMENLTLLAQFEAKPGKEQQVADFLKSALPLAEAEPGTIRWYALQIGSSTFGIFDTFADEAGRDAHLGGEIAKALMASADELLVSTPVIDKVKILAFK